jgi:hypothetical protein
MLPVNVSVVCLLKRYAAKLQIHVLSMLRSTTLSHKFFKLHLSIYMKTKAYGSQGLALTG